MNSISGLWGGGTQHVKASDWCTEIRIVNQQPKKKSSVLVGPFSWTCGCGYSGLCWSTWLWLRWDNSCLHASFLPLIKSSILCLFSVKSEDEVLKNKLCLCPWNNTFSPLFTASSKNWRVRVRSQNLLLKLTLCWTIHIFWMGLKTKVATRWNPHMVGWLSCCHCGIVCALCDVTRGHSQTSQRFSTHF